MTFLRSLGHFGHQRDPRNGKARPGLPGLAYPGEAAFSAEAGQKYAFRQGCATILGKWVEAGGAGGGFCGEARRGPFGQLLVLLNKTPTFKGERIERYLLRF